MRESSSQPASRLLLVVCLLFFGSGFAALIYQVVWLRSLSLVFGVTVHAASTVLASFMAGLAVGSAVAGRLVLAPRQALAAFAVIETGVGLTAVLAGPLVGWMTAGYGALGPHLPESLTWLTVLRFAMASAALIVPTSLMGATLPVLVQATGADPRLGARLSTLYATNTAGAIVGALAAGFWLVPNLGLRSTSWLAASVNGGVAIAALLLRRSTTAVAAPVGTVDESPAVPGDAPATDVSPDDPAVPRAVLGVFAASGFVSLALEMVWFRVLALHLRPTAYSFTIMLATVLGGIAVGSYAVTPLFRRPRPWLAVLASLQLLVALVALLSLNLAGLVPFVERVVSPALALVGVDPYVSPLVAASLVSILPTSCLLGAAFPIGLRIAIGNDVAAASRRVAQLYSLNVFGAILGATLAGFVLLPGLGTRGTLIALAFITLVSSLVLAYRVWPTSPNVAGFLSIVGPVSFVMAAVNVVDPFTDFLARERRAERLLWVAEGVQTTVSVHRRPGVPENMSAMYLDGMHQADDSAATANTHHALGALPMMLHPNPTRVLVIGLGGGATPGAASMFPGSQVDVVELSPEVVLGARHFGHINYDVLTRLNVRLRVDDGRNYLLTSAAKYDVITADLILPNRAGASSLYSREYFELVRRALAPGGIVLQWLGANSDFEYKLIMRTFLSVFPETTLWGDHSLMVGTAEPFGLSQARFAERRRDPRFRAVFDWDLDTLRRLYVAGPRSMAAYVGEGPLMRDDRPVTEYFLSLPGRGVPVALDGLTGSFDEVLRP